MRRSALLALAALACSTSPAPDRWTEAGPVAEKHACNPLASEWDCLYPYPSDFFTRPDATSATRQVLEIPAETLPHWQPKNDELQPIDFLALHPSDGFSVLPQIGVRIPGSVDAKDLVGMYGDVSASLKADSHTLLLDAETGEPVLHFSETDPRPAGVDDRILLLRPLVRLKSAHRYVVALRGLHHVDGSAISAPAGFRAIRDGEAADPLLERLGAYFDAHVFPVLEKAGVKRPDLILAWDFTTESDARTTGDMLEMRRQLLAKLAESPVEAQVTKVIDAPATEQVKYIGREVQGTMKVPSFMEDPKPGGLLHRGPDGKPAIKETIDVAFTVRIPNSVLKGEKPGRLVQYGHGFFGGHLGEIRGAHPSRFAEETGSVIVATDWAGMTAADRIDILGNVITDPSRIPSFTDRTHQGMMNFIALAELARTSLGTHAELQDSQGKPLFDASHVYFYGISQGSILGKTYVALSPQIDRAALTVGGCGFGFMMSRALPFGPLLSLMETGINRTDVDTRAETTRLELLMQTSLDRIDPVAYAPHLLADTYAGSPAGRRVLLQIGVGDAQVPNVAEHVFARTAGIPLRTPAPRTIAGLATKDAPIDGSALVEWDFGLEPVDTSAMPVAEDTPVHEGLRQQPGAIRMIDAFLRPDGRVTDTCGGVCRAGGD